MIITLDNKQQIDVSKVYSSPFSVICNKRAFKKSQQYNKSGYVFIGGLTESNMPNGGFFGLLQYAYINHLNVTINPTDIWAVLIGQFINIVSDAPFSYGLLFTKDVRTKKTLSVPTSSRHVIPVTTLTKRLSEELQFDSSLVLQKFSTNTTESDLALQVMLCDMASPFYNYSMYLCGINQIKIGGTQEDWYMLTKAFNSLIDTFLGHDRTDALVEYKDRINGLLMRFALVFDGVVDIDFWKGIYTQKNVGSGSQVEVTGWCKDFAFKTPKPCYVENLTFDFGFIDYCNLSTKENFGMIAGAFHSELKDGFYELVYSSTVFQYLEAEQYQQHLENERKERQLAQLMAMSLSDMETKKETTPSVVVPSVIVKSEPESGFYYCPHIPNIKQD